MTDELLSEGEGRVLLALGRGLTTKEIASELGVAEGTIRGFLGRIFLKLRVDDRDAAVKRARRLGLL